jgi:hypothetical protein
VPALAPSRTIVKSTYIISDLSSDVRNTADFSFEAGCGRETIHGKTFSEIVYMKTHSETGCGRETIHGKTFSEIMYMKIAL